MATLGQVIATAQKVYLNDANGNIWNPSTKLIPFAQEACRQLQIELNVNGIPVIKKRSVTVVVPQIPNLATWPGYVLMPNQPSDIIEPIACWERPTNDTLNSDFDEMVQKSFTPRVQPVNDLVYWSWFGEKIVFVGALQDNEVQLDYNGGLSIPQAQTDPLGFINAEVYVAPKLAALASDSIGGEKRAAKNEAIAQSMLEKVLQYNILAEQGMVSRRKPYRHGMCTFVIR